jgi:hypothetical protein
VRARREGGRCRTSWYATFNATIPSATARNETAAVRTGATSEVIEAGDERRTETRDDGSERLHDWVLFLIPFHPLLPCPYYRLVPTRELAAITHQSTVLTSPSNSPVPSRLHLPSSGPNQQLPHPDE